MANISRTHESVQPTTQEVNAQEVAAREVAAQEAQPVAQFGTSRTTHEPPMTYRELVLTRIGGGNDGARRATEDTTEHLVRALQRLRQAVEQLDGALRRLAQRLGNTATAGDAITGADTANDTEIGTTGTDDTADTDIPMDTVVDLPDGDSWGESY